MEERNQLYNVLEQYHSTFSLDEGEQGETNLVEFNIDTGESTPINQVAHRVPFAVRQEIAAQLETRGRSNTTIKESLGKPRGFSEEAGWLTDILC